jgi:hypothetical protein
MIEIGDIVRTSYNTGPYRVVKIDRGCCCPSYFEDMEYMGRPGAKPSEPHIHMTLVKTDFPTHRKPSEADCYWINGYAWKGGRWRSVWNSRDYLIVEGHAAGAQLELFG